MESALVVTTPATSQELTTIATVRAVGGITETQVSDANMAILIRQASGICADYLRMPLGEETLTETFWQTGASCSDLLFLSRRPIVSVTSVTEDDVLLVVTTDYRQTATGLRRVSSGAGRAWGNGIVVVYVAGYALLGALPHAAERACIELVRYFSINSRDASLKRKSTEVPGVFSTESEWFGISTGALPREVTDLLDLVPRPMVA